MDDLSPLQNFFVLGVRRWWCDYRFDRRTHFEEYDQDQRSLPAQLHPVVRIGRFSFSRGFSVHHFSRRKGEAVANWSSPDDVDQNGETGTVTLRTHCEL
jgi:hypothetical protein